MEGYFQFVQIHITLSTLDHNTLLAILDGSIAECVVFMLGNNSYPLRLLLPRGGFL
jgi:hypothetical protein